MQWHIICGEDTVASRKKYNAVLDSYKKDNRYVIEIGASTILDELPQKAIMNGLFYDPNIFTTSRLVPVLKRKKSVKPKEWVARISHDIILVSWEDIAGRDVSKTWGALVTDHPLSQTIFTFLDACYPVNKKQFVSLRRSLEQYYDNQFLFTMLVKHIKTIIELQKTGTVTGKQSWQIRKLSNIADKWKQSLLTSFYLSLGNLDKSIKTSTNVHGVGYSLDILACYYL